MPVPFLIPSNTTIAIKAQKMRILTHESLRSLFSGLEKIELVFFLLKKGKE
jgi:hypothetical protein